MTNSSHSGGCGGALASNSIFKQLSTSMAPRTPIQQLLQVCFKPIGLLSSRRFPSTPTKKHSPSFCPSCRPPTLCCLLVGSCPFLMLNYFFRSSGIRRLVPMASPMVHGLPLQVPVPNSCTQYTKPSSMAKHHLSTSTTPR